MASHRRENALSERSESKGGVAHQQAFGRQALPIAAGRWHRRLVWSVYILRCHDGSLYIGQTNDVARRVARHNDGTAATHTARRRPVRLVYEEAHASRADCLKRERQLKRWTSAKKEALISGDKALLKKL
jgi:putative endonuclease